MFRGMLRNFCETKVEPQALEHNRLEKFNRELFGELGGLGCLGITVAEEYGGSAMDATAVVIAMEELSAADPAFCLSYLAHATLFVNNLHINGSHAQKAKYLPSACDGTKVGGMCMSEPGAGTDVLGMSTKAVKQDDGDYLITGQKMWITNGTLDGETTGDVFLVYARTGEKRTDISMFIVEKGMPGFTLGQKIENKLGMRASMTAELVFEDVRVPPENIVGTVNGASLCMMRNLEVERVALAAMSTGIARRCIEEMNKYSEVRKAFGKPLNAFGQTQKQIAESYAEYMAGKAYVYHTANNLDLNSTGNVLDSDGVKLYAAKMSKEVADRAIQILGGNGYTGEYRVEQMWRDAKLLEIGGGTNEAHHKNMVNWFKKSGHELP
jgi:isovaleryl-CoA dehydrogenase